MASWAAAIFWPYGSRKFASLRDLAEATGSPTHSWYRARIVGRIRRHGIRRLLAIVHIEAVFVDVARFRRLTAAATLFRGLATAFRSLCSLLLRRRLRIGTRITAIVSAAHFALEVTDHLIDVQFLWAGDDDIVPATVKRVTGIDEDLAASARKTG